MCGHSPCDKDDCTWGESHRAKAEITYVQSMADFEQGEYLKLVAKQRGEAVAQKLRADACMGQSKNMHPAPAAARSAPVTPKRLFAALQASADNGASMVDPGSFDLVDKPVMRAKSSSSPSLF